MQQTQLIILIGFLWLIRTLKHVFFWIYLWQLKEYHIGRFIDHFRTNKGKKIFIDFLPIIKVILFISLIFSYSLFLPVFYILLLIYILESIVFILKFLKGIILRPVFTFKVIFSPLQSWNIPNKEEAWPFLLQIKKGPR